MSNPNRHRGGGGRGAAPPIHSHFPNPYQQNTNPSFSQQNPNPSFFQQNPNRFHPADVPSAHHSPTFGVGDLTNHPLSHGGFQNYPQFIAGGLQQQQQSPHGGYQQQFLQRPAVVLENVEKAVSKAVGDFLAAKVSVSAWRVVQSALSMLQVDSFSSLGLHLQDIPSLHKLILTEGKVNSFIHCFVGARRITSLYDLDTAICKSEGVDRFEELGLGSLLGHPLVIHYFCTPPDAIEVFKITSDEIICDLSDFMDKCTEKEIHVESFLDFLAKKRSVSVPNKLCIRIQSLGLHIMSIREAKKSEKATLQKYLKSLKQSVEEQTSTVLGSGARQHPSIQSQKKKLDQRFNAISESVKSFSSMNKDFVPNKHIKFVSSSSEDENNDVDDEGEDINNLRDAQRTSNCPYPSAAEEMERLGLKLEVGGHAASATIDLSCGEGQRSSRKKSKKEKRKYRKAKQKYLLSKYLPKSSNIIHTLSRTSDPKEEDELTLTGNNLENFVTTWKDACREHSVVQVLDRMINFYKVAPRQKEKLRSIFSVYPCVGLLNIAVNSLKYGMWDSIYDTFQTIGGHGFVTPDSDPDLEMIDVEPPVEKEKASSSKDCIAEPQNTITVDDISKKVAAYFELDPIMPSERKFPLENLFPSLKRIWDCELWLKKQFFINEFSTLGHGKFIEFLEEHTSLLPSEVRDVFTKELSGKSSFEVCILQNQLHVMLSQVASVVGDDNIITKEQVAIFLQKQFPLISFEIKGSDPEGYFLDLVRNHKNFVSSSKHVLFSFALSETCLLSESRVGSESSGLTTDICCRVGPLGSVSGKDALQCLLKAPMLSDLKSWSHWDLIFAPSLGPLLEWLLNESNTEELSCIATRDGKLIRINHLTTVDSFLESALQGSSFQTAVALLSVLALYEGTSHAPVSLLKCHASEAIEVIVKNSMGCIELNNTKNNELSENLCKLNNSVGIAARFVLDCIGHLPSEFHSFAADILLSGLRSLTSDAPAVILRECDGTDQRVMLHRIGFSLGILDWVEDFHIFRSMITNDVGISSGTSTKKSKTLSSALEMDFEVKSSKDYHQETFDEGNKRNVSDQEPSEKPVDSQHPTILEDNRDHNATLIIESIRRDEFGLDPDLEYTESSLLKKQHARLGRALHCLSQELYSQDSHFLLELVQNADDNLYPDNVDPTLVFILQDSGITVLNNERGFSAQNIKALCDVGNSTKKGSIAGYIGQKGIGFKSVFRVTNAPEIHSNGFHVKFDTSEGQIGFVLPTVIPPCDVELFRRLLSTKESQTDTTSWNTCIVLPFKSKLKGVAMTSIMSMFSDLHPSLLLFLHRLRCIEFRSLLDDSHVVLRRETVGNGIVKVSHGKETMIWLVATQTLLASTIRPDVQTTEIAIAFTLEESGNGEYIPHLDQQPVFAFLPLRTYGLKFILQGDFVLPSSREEVDGDSSWNQWLLSEFPGLFISAEGSFCALPCFQENPGKAVTIYMSFVPLPGEVHGFFSRLPHMVISKLRMSNCLLVEGKNLAWVPPCRVLRGWDEQARVLLPESLLHHHLGLGYLHKDISLSDTLANALGIQNYGPRILIEIIKSICRTDNGLNLLGLDWLSSWLNALYHTLPVQSEGPQSYFNVGKESDLFKILKEVPFIPLSDGSYSSLDEGPIWLPCDTFGTWLEGEHIPKVFPSLYAKLRTVNSGLLSTNAINPYNTEDTRVGTVLRMLRRIGVQQLSAHEVIRTHIIPAMSDDKLTDRDKHLITEYLSFVMLHLQSDCISCRSERAEIISEMQNKAFILTNNGYKRLVEESIHFSKDFGNTVDLNKLVRDMDMKWNEIDTIYLKHFDTHTSSVELVKWRAFFQELGVTDFVKIICVEKDVVDWVLTDWESPELLQLLSAVSSKKVQEKCNHLLEVLDELWDGCFCTKVESYCTLKSTKDKRPVESSFMKNIHEFKWVVSSMDSELHYPKDLFDDCEAVRSILGSFAPYAVPQVRSKKFLHDIGFKTQVTLDDALTVLRTWRTSKTPFRASISQMSRFYSFIADMVATAKGKCVEELTSERCIFVPLAGISSYEEPLCGVFLSSNEVYWQDPTGAADRVRDLILSCASINSITCPSSNILSHVYPNLQSFFVNECGIHDAPPFGGYLQILKQLSSIALPSQSADVVFRVLLKWAIDMKSGLLKSEEISHLKESLHRFENTVLPTSQDKWVSLHPRFGLVCWCDDEELRDQFEDSKNIKFLRLDTPIGEGGKMLQGQIGLLFQTIGIPALSEVVSREAIFNGTQDCGEMASLVDWVLPYAQRYISGLHPETYLHLKQSGFENLNQLQIVVVRYLYYKYIIKGYGDSSKKQFECRCLLQGNILYITWLSDSHSIFMEMSRLFFNSSTDLHLANFLHMVTTMEESGSRADRIESFIAKSQKLPKLSDEEPLWSLPCLPSLHKTNGTEPNTITKKRKSGISSSWPATDWDTAPDCNSFRLSRFKMQPASDVGYQESDCNSFRSSGFETQPASDVGYQESDKPEVTTLDLMLPVDISGDWIIQDESESTMMLTLKDSNTTQDQSLPEEKKSSELPSNPKKRVRKKRRKALVTEREGLSVGILGNSSDKTKKDQSLPEEKKSSEKPSSPKNHVKKKRRKALVTERERLSVGILGNSSDKRREIGRLGELAAYQYFVGRFGQDAVKWVNEEMETGAPYDLIIGQKGKRWEYVEVKATSYANKDWFEISPREWEFAIAKGNFFSIAYVALDGEKQAKVTIFKNPVKLYNQKLLKLAILMLGQQ